MGDKTEIDNSFDLCAVKLWNLPSQFKKWQTLCWYRSFWNFVNKASIRENICESHMAFHYLYSLDLWLRPGLTIKTGHNLLCLQAAVAIYEAVLFDLLSLDVNDAYILEEVSKWPAAKTRDLLYKKKAFDKSWNRRISKAHDMRNLIHLQKMDVPPLRKQLRDLDVSALNSEIEQFNAYIKDTYKKSQKST